jgi:hypothetical protein
MEDVGIFMAYLSTYLSVKWYILWQIGTFCGRLVHFSRFDMLYVPRIIL